MSNPSASPATRHALSAQLEVFNSFLAMASDLQLRDGGEIRPMSSPESISTAQLVLDSMSLQKQLSEIENRLRTIHKLCLAGDVNCYGIDDRIRCLNDFADQLVLVQQHRSLLIDKLNQPRVAEHILMDHQYHKDFVQLFCKIQEQVPVLQQNLEVITWKDEFLSSTTELEQMRKSLDELTELTQRQAEIADASQRLQSSLINVLQHSKRTRLSS